MTNDNVSSPTKSRQLDPFTLRVRGGDPNDNDPSKRPTDPMGLSRSILHVLEKNPGGFVKVQSVGGPALKVTMSAFRMASKMLEERQQGVVLVVRQSEYIADVGGKRTRGICTRIFSIPIQYAL